jgi:formate dehydrogenase subunit gamma
MSIEMITKLIRISAIENETNRNYFTYVEGVGSIPRDIYKHVESNPMGDLPRYSMHIVIQHILIFSTFFILAATGLPIYFSDLAWAQHLTSFLGGIDVSRIIHKTAAFIMIFASAYHLATVTAGTLRKIIKKEFDIKRTQIPRLKDLYDLIHDVRYFLGLEPYRPKMEKFMYKQKLHYLAILWGSAVLIVAGSTLLFPDIMMNIFSSTFGKLPSQILPGGKAFPAIFLQELARLMHADEAIMALIVLAFWHLTNVHLVPGRFPAQWTFLTGKITREHQIEEHFLEYLNNLRELPEEREYMKNLLIKLGVTTKNLEAEAPQKAPECSREEPCDER